MKAEIYKDEGFELMGALLQLNSITISVGAEWSSGQPGGLLVLCLLNGWCFVAPSLACGEARGGSIPRSGAVTDEQRSQGQTGRNPKGGSPFRSRLCCSLLADPLRDMLVARASPGPKNHRRKTPAI